MKAKRRENNFKGTVRQLFRRRRQRHDPRKARPEGSQFDGTGWIAQPVRVPDSLRQLASVERAAAERRSGDPLLVLNIAIFNFTDGWNRTFSKYEDMRSYA